MFIPNTRAILRCNIGNDLYGEPAFGPEVSIACGIVRLELQSVRSSIRTDASASKGSAVEEVAKSRILVPRNVRVSKGDQIRIGDITLIVKSSRPQFGVSGKIDHFQLDLTISTNYDLGEN